MIVDLNVINTKITELYKIAQAYNISEPDGNQYVM